jgi:hypothetical protein
MAAIDNLSFEINDGGIGALDWTLEATSSVEDINVYADFTTKEGFENGWDSNEDYEFALTTLNSSENQWTNPVSTVPLFQEGFEVGWGGNQNYDVSLSGVSYSFSGLPSGQEGFETGWGNSSYQVSFPLSQAASLTGNVPPIANGVADLIDGFESGWNNSSYETAFTDQGGTATSSGNVWDRSRSSTKETFEFVQADFPVVFSTSTTTFATTIANPIVNGYQMEFYSNTGSLPVPFASGLPYQAANISGNNVEAHILGTLVQCTVLGSGIVYVTLPYEFWTVQISL